MAKRTRMPVDDDINLDSSVDEPIEDPAARRRRLAQEEGEIRFQRAKAWAQEQSLLRVEVETPSGRLVTYKDPALYLEAFAAEEVRRARREWEQAK